MRLGLRDLMVATVFVTVVLTSNIAGSSSAGPGHGPKVTKIFMNDLEVAGVRQSSTAQDIKRRLGPPATTHQAVPNVPQATGGYSWNYRDLDFTFDGQGHRLMAV